MAFLDHDREEQFQHYSHRIDHSGPVVEINFSLLVEDGAPEFNEFIQGVADGMMKLLRELRENFPHEKFDYYGVRFDEWLTGPPAMEPYLMSKDLPERPYKLNVGVAPHVITRKYYPFTQCVSCNMRNTDYCRLRCEDEHQEGDETPRIEDFSHEK